MSLFVHGPAHKITFWHPYLFPFIQTTVAFLCPLIELPCLLLDGMISFTGEESIIVQLYLLLATCYKKIVSLLIYYEEWWSKTHIAIFISLISSPTMLIIPCQPSTALLRGQYIPLSLSLQLETSFSDIS